MERRASSGRRQVVAEGGGEGGLVARVDHELVHDRRNRLRRGGANRPGPGLGVDPRGAAPRPRLAPGEEHGLGRAIGARSPRPPPRLRAWRRVIVGGGVPPSAAWRAASIAAAMTRRASAAISAAPLPQRAAAGPARRPAGQRGVHEPRRRQTPGSASSRLGRGDGLGRRRGRRPPAWPRQGQPASPWRSRSPRARSSVDAAAASARQGRSRPISASRARRRRRRGAARRALGSPPSRPAGRVEALHRGGDARPRAAAAGRRRLGLAGGSPRRASSPSPPCRRRRGASRSRAPGRLRPCQHAAAQRGAAELAGDLAIAPAWRACCQAPELGSRAR